jgi:hypothetical protein
LSAFLFASFASQASETKYPKEVQTVLDGVRGQCRDAGGDKVILGAGAVKKLDLTGEGNDYVVDLSEAECHGMGTLYCGSGGCDLIILAGKRGGSLVKVFDERARSYEILPGQTPRTIRFNLHGMYCGLAGYAPCAKTHRITMEPFEFKAPR